jgi:hypothetical protein
MESGESKNYRDSSCRRTSGKRKFYFTELILFPFGTSMFNKLSWFKRKTKHARMGAKRTKDNDVDSETYIQLFFIDEFWTYSRHELYLASMNRFVLKMLIRALFIIHFYTCMYMLTFHFRL